MLSKVYHNELCVVKLIESCRDGKSGDIGRQPKVCVVSNCFILGFTIGNVFFKMHRNKGKIS